MHTARRPLLKQARKQQAQKCTATPLSALNGRSIDSWGEVQVRRGVSNLWWFQRLGYRDAKIEHTFT